MRDARESVQSAALGSLESFLAYLQSLMTACDTLLQDEAAMEQTSGGAGPGPGFAGMS